MLPGYVLARANVALPGPVFDAAGNFAWNGLVPGDIVFVNPSLPYIRGVLGGKFITLVDDAQHVPVPE